MTNSNNSYDDIINLPRHISKKRTPMPVANRAAQFSPFAALTGYEAAIDETARLTDKEIPIDDDRRDMLDFRLHILSERTNERPTVQITYFKPDERKSGGSYDTIIGEVRRIDDFEMLVIFTDDSRIPIGWIYSIEGEIFRSHEREFEKFL